MNPACAEIIESSIHTFKAHCWKWDQTPTFGSLVVVNSGARTIFGIVNQIQTGSRDPQRIPFPFQKTEAELLREQPQIFAFLATTFTCIAAGYKTIEATTEIHKPEPIAYQWTPEPPKVHAFVHEATHEQYEQFFACEQYMHILFSISHQVSHLDELLLAILKQLSDRKLLKQEQLNKCIETLSLLTGNDYRRLKLFLQRAAACVRLEP